MLRTRQLVNGFYIPQHDHYRYSLLYHALMHKVNIPADYDQLLGQLGFSSSDYMQELTRFMQQHNYHFTEPHDHSVYFNVRKIGRATSINRKLSAARTLTKRTLRDGTQFCTGKMKGALRRFAHLIHH